MTRRLRLQIQGKWMEQYLKGGGREQCDQVCQKFAIFDKVLKVFDNY